MWDRFTQMLHAYLEIAIFLSRAIGYWIGDKTIPGPGLGAVTATLLTAIAIGNVSTLGYTVTYAVSSTLLTLWGMVLVMETIGTDTLRDKIGASPTGMPFNSVQAIESHGGRPLNPFVNAGAIATTSLVQGPDTDAKWSKIIDGMNKLAIR
jgi:glutaminase